MSAGDRLAPGRKSGSTCLSHGCAVLAGRAAVHTPEHPYARHPDGKTENRTPYGRLCVGIWSTVPGTCFAYNAFHPAHRLRNLRFRGYPVQCHLDSPVRSMAKYGVAGDDIHRGMVGACPVLHAEDAWAGVSLLRLAAPPVDEDVRLTSPFQWRDIQLAGRPPARLCSTHAILLPFEKW